MLSFISVNGENPKDSLLAIFYNNKDSAGVRAGFELNKYFINKKAQPDSVLFYTPQFLETAISINDYFGETKSLIWMGNAYFFKRDYTNATSWYNKALLSAVKHKQLSLQADIYNRLGACYNNQNKYDKAVSALINAATIFEQLHELPGLAQAYYAISLAYKVQKQPERRLFYSMKAAAIAKQLPETESVKKAFIFASTATCLIELNANNASQLKQAYVIAQEGYQLAISKKLNTYIPQYFIVFSGYYYAVKNYQLSINYALKGLTFNNTLTDEERFNLFYRLAEGYREDREIKQAYAYIDSATQLAIAKMPVYAANLAQSVYRLNKMTGESDKALQAFENYKQIQDSLVSVEKNKTINELEQKYQSELKDIKILQLEQEKINSELRMRSVIAFGIIVLLVILFLLVVYKQKHTQNKLRIAEAEQRLNRARMNPHFFFNTLTALQGMVLTQKDVAQTATIISRTARLMRQSLEATFTEFVTIEEDVAFLKEYMEVLLLKNNNLFTYSFMVDDELEDALVPVMLIQPFVENAIEHGFKNINHQGEINISYQLQQQNIVITVADNGVGINNNASKQHHTSRALQIINDRLTLLNNKHAGYTISPQLQGSGTVIEITIPKKIT